MSEEQNKTITIREFKAMINGMDLIADGDDWAPNASQWKRIRKMIENLADEQSAPVAQVPVQYVPHNAERSQRAPLPVDSANPLENDSPEFIAPAPPGSVPQTGPVRMGATSSSLAPAVRPSQPQPQVSGKQAGGTVKTPDIDSTNGYESTFV